MNDEIIIENQDAVYINNDLKSEVIRLMDCDVDDIKISGNKIYIHLKELDEYDFGFSLTNFELMNLTSYQEPKDLWKVPSDQNKLVNVSIKKKGEDREYSALTKISKKDKVVVGLLMTNNKRAIVIEIQGDNFDIEEVSKNRK